MSAVVMMIAMVMDMNKNLFLKKQIQRHKIATMVESALLKGRNYSIQLADKTN